MRSLLLILALSLPGIASAQFEQSAPEELVSSLTARVSAFYTAFQAGQFRQAEDFVDEESKELYYNVQKSRIMGHEIKSITWADDFRSARVMIVAMSIVPMVATNKPVPVPVGGMWKLIDGEWYLHLPAPDQRRTPFGIAGPSTAAALGQSAGALIPQGAGVTVPSIAEMRQMLTLDESKVVFPAGLTEATVKTIGVTSKAPTGFILQVELPESIPAGLTVQIDPADVQPGTEANITITYDPAVRVLSGERTLSFDVSPSGQRLEVTVEFEPVADPEPGP
jgi:hypothetical protein